MRLLTFLAKSAKIWPVWRTVELGTYPDVKSMKAAIEGAGMFISSWAGDVLPKVSFSSERKTLDLVVVTVAELGFPRGAKTREIFAAAQKQGLSLCPSEVGPQLRLQYKDQPRSEWIHIAMRPLNDSGYNYGLFFVGCDEASRLWLYDAVGVDGRWDSKYRLVFVLGN